MYMPGVRNVYTLQLYFLRLIALKDRLLYCEIKINTLQLADIPNAGQKKKINYLSWL